MQRIAIIDWEPSWNLEFKKAFDKARSDKDKDKDYNKENDKDNDHYPTTCVQIPYGQFNESSGQP